MFVGHPATGLAAKRLAPRVSLGALVVAPMLLDLLWPVFLLLDIEHVRVAPGITKFVPMDFYDYPWSHSLLMTIVWSILFAGIYWMRTRDGRGATVLGILVTSHWVLDFVTHRPDLPLYPGGPKYGLGLWNSIPGTIIVETLIFIAGVALYVSVTRGRDRIGRTGFWLYVAFLAFAHVANMMGGTPPSDQRLIAMGSLMLAIIPFWAWWVDRHRTATG